MKQLICLILSLFLAGCLSAQAVFRHVTAAANTSGHITRLDHPQLNGNPKAMVFVTTNWGTGGVGMDYGNNVGVWYNGSRWTIFNQNTKLPMPPGVTFNVMTVPEGTPGVFRHTVTAASKSANGFNNGSQISHPSIDGKDGVIIMATQCWTGTYNDNPIQMGNRGGCGLGGPVTWTIANGATQANGSDYSNFPMPVGASFNIMVIENGRVPGFSTANAYTHVAKPETIIPAGQHISFLDNPALNGKPDAMLFVMPFWGRGTICTDGPYVLSPTSVWYDHPQDAWKHKEGFWSVYHGKGGIPMPNGSKFNVVVVPGGNSLACPEWTGTYESINRTTIQNAQGCLSANRVNGSNNTSNRLQAGTILFYRTNEGRLGKLEILEYGYNIRLRCHVYNADGSVFRQNANLTIRGTWSCDLDNGEESGTGSDFFWEQNTAIERYITPRNNALFWVAKAGGGGTTPPVGGGLRGWVDMHTHPMSHLGFGRKAMHGAPGIGCIIPAGTHNCNPTEFRATSISQALGNCNSTHGGWGTDNGCGDYLRAGIINYALDDEFEHKVSFDRNPHGDHEHGGYPGLNFWPNHTSILHQQMWTDWIRRARDGGLRVMVALTVNSELLADIINGDGPYDDKTVADIQIDETVRFVNDNRSFMEIAYSKADLERIVKSNKIAVVLGMEVDKIGNFGKQGVVTNEATVRAEIQRLYNKGIRYVFPIHLVDNSFGGAAVYEMLFNFANKHANGRHFSVTTSSDPNVQYRANVTDGPLGFENGLILGVRGFLEGLGQIPAPCFNDAIKCFPPPGKVRCCGSYERILGVMSPAPEFDAYKFVSGGHVNSNGLTSLGEAAIDEMMKLGMMIDIDHMSERSMTRTIELAERRSGGYPLNMGHNGIRGPGGNERGAPIALIRRIATLGGMMGTGTAKATHDGFTTAYRDLWRAMGNRGVAIGSDVNGFEPLPHRAAGKGDDNASNTFYNTFFAQSGISTKCKTGDRTWDYVKDGGVSHYGIMPEFLHEVKTNGGEDVINNLNTSAEHFAQMWAKCERLSTTTAAGITEITLAGISSDIHNNDCKRFYGTVELEVWQTDASGNRTTRITPTTGGGTLINWDRGPARDVGGFPGAGVMMPNTLKINSIYAVDRTLLNQNRIRVVVKTKLGSAHKGCDLCTDFTWDAAMPSTREQTFSLRDVLNQSGAVKSMVVGPYAASDNRHSIRVHFEVR